MRQKFWDGFMVGLATGVVILAIAFLIDIQTGYIIFG